MTSQFNKIFRLMLLVTALGCQDNDTDPRFKEYFVKYYGGEGTQNGVDFSVLDDGFVLLGTTARTGQDTLVFLVRTDDLGNEIWHKEFGGLTNSQSASMAIDANGDYLVAATINNQGDKDVMLLKISPEGTRLDSMVYGNKGEADIASNIITTDNGDVIIIGTTTDERKDKPGYNPITDTEDIYSLRISPQFELLNTSDWVRTTGFSGRDQGVQIVQKSDGTFLIFGSTNTVNSSNNQQQGFNMFLFPVRGDGIAIAAFQFFGTLSDESGAQIIETSDNGYAMIGTSTKPGGTSDIYISRIDNDNRFISATELKRNRNLKGRSIALAASGGFIVLGEEINGEDVLLYLAKTTASGSVIWERDFGYSKVKAGKVRELSDGSIVFIASVELGNQYKMALVKLNNNGEFLP